MRLSRSTLLAVFSLVAFVLLGILQVWWFRQTFHSEQRQLDRSVRLAVRHTADGTLKAAGDSTRAIPPVQRMDDGTYTVRLSTGVDYATTDSVWKAAMTAFRLDMPYQLSLNDCATGEVVLGGLGLPEQPMPLGCVDRANEVFCADLAISVGPGLPYWTGRLGWWIITTFVLLALFGFYASTVWTLVAQRRLEKIRTDLIHNLTHELKTPVTNVALASEVLAHRANELDTSRTAHYVDIIRQENKRLQQQIEQLLEMAAMDQGGLTLNKEQVNLHELLQQAIQNMTLRLEERGGSIMTSLKAAKPLVWGDPTYLARALGNLLDNAEKYSPDQPAISVTTQTLDQEVVVVVEDQGMGMTENVKQSIFNKFYRAPAAGRQQPVKGFGLGLSYVQSVLKNHRGRIRVQSTPGHGSRFELYFPLIK